MNKEFSKKWVVISMMIFLAAELIIGVFLGKVVSGVFLTYQFRYVLQGLLNVASFFIGGLIIGAISPGVRLLEPAVGAFLAVFVMILLSMITPFGFFHFSLTKIIVGGGIAFFFALLGAHFGEKLTGN